jgi:hypothetical protein
MIRTRAFSMFNIRCCSAWTSGVTELEVIVEDGYGPGSIAHFPSISGRYTDEVDAMGLALAPGWLHGLHGCTVGWNQGNSSLLTFVPHNSSRLR